jgi:glycosyltransferase involved in cell wall biosynthesis
MPTPFTVIIPTYNRARFIGEAVKSILAQTLPAHEIIVVDDGSTDNTPEVLQAFASKITVIRQKNAGASAARNTGILHSKTEWLAFLDSDDTWCSNYLEKQNEQIERYPHAVAHLTNALILHPDGKKENLYEVFRYTPKVSGADKVLLERPMASVIRHVLTFFQTTVVRRDAIIKAGMFPAEIRVGGEDMHLMPRIALLGPFGINHEPLVHIQRRVENMTNLSAVGRIKGLETQATYVRIYSSLCALPGLNLEEMALLKYTLSAALRSLGNLQMRVGHVKEARQSFKQAFKTAPSFKSTVKLLAAYCPLPIRSLLDRKATNVTP